MNVQYQAFQTLLVHTKHCHPRTEAYREQAANGKFSSGCLEITSKTKGLLSS